MTPEEARKELTRNHGWAGTTLDVWLRANGQCEYCEVDLVASPDLYFHGGHLDHIVPDAGDGLDNLALACAACNRMKRRFDSRLKDTAGATRAVLVEAARQRIVELRTRDTERLQSACALLRTCGMTRAEWK
jgi:5-methylcytosine-specific restriction endonuclease McrA